VLSRISSSRLTPLIVWVPQLAGTRAAAINASRLIDDSRAMHFWDKSDVSGEQFAGVLQTPGPAWDVYLAYAPGIRWGPGAPPKPTFWMQQMGMASVPYLDASVLAGHVRELLDARGVINGAVVRDLTSG
jgi:hypothetical protein